VTVKYYKLENTGICEINYDEFLGANKAKKALFLVDIRTTSREKAVKHISSFGISNSITKLLAKPSDNIRFEYFGESLYGELANFSPKDKTSTYSALIIKQNIFIGIHPENEKVLARVEAYFKENILGPKNEMNAERMLFALILEILSNYGKLIIKYREEIESFAFDLDNKEKEISPEDILLSKSQMSEFSRVLERLYFTLSFPPTKDILDSDGVYSKPFDYLLKSADLLRSSIKLAEDRLDSLNDHYQLLLHNKSTKRLNLLTIIQAVFIPLTLIAGIYGMNFANMPELDFKYGYYLSLVAMVLFAISAIYYFYKNGWFEE